MRKRAARITSVIVTVPSLSRERIGAAALTALVVVALGYALMLGLSLGNMTTREQATLATFDVAVDPPKRDRVVPPPRKIDRPSGRASPPNLRSRATAITAPIAIVQLIPPSPVIVATLPDIGTQVSSGATDRAGPGTGAGGIGDGHGAGGDGDGDGSGLERVPRLITGRIRRSDIPEPILDTGFHGMVDVRFQVETDGHVTDCTVMRSSGNALIDQATCRVIEKRFRYRPWLDEAGRPVRSWVLREQQWDIDAPTIGR